MKDSSIDKLYFKKKKKIEAIYLSFISNLKKEIILMKINHLSYFIVLTYFLVDKQYTTYTYQKRQCFFFSFYSVFSCVYVLLFLFVSFFFSFLFCIIYKRNTLSFHHCCRLFELLVGGCSDVNISRFETTKITTTTNLI